MIVFPANPIIPADYKNRRERTSLRSLSLTSGFHFIPLLSLENTGPLKRTFCPALGNSAHKATLHQPFIAYFLVIPIQSAYIMYSIKIFYSSAYFYCICSTLRTDCFYSCCAKIFKNSCISGEQYPPFFRIAATRVYIPFSLSLL